MQTGNHLILLWSFIHYSQAEENTGMAMIFTLVSVALEWLNERWDSSVKEKEDEEEKRRLQDEEEEHVCAV